MNSQLRYIYIRVKLWIIIKVLT